VVSIVPVISPASVVQSPPIAWFVDPPLLLEDEDDPPDDELLDEDDELLDDDDDPPLDPEDELDPLLLELELDEEFEPLLELPDDELPLDEFPPPHALSEANTIRAQIISAAADLVGRPPRWTEVIIVLMTRPLSIQALMFAAPSPETTFKGVDPQTYSVCCSFCRADPCRSTQ